MVFRLLFRQYIPVQTTCWGLEARIGLLGRRDLHCLRRLYRWLRSLQYAPGHHHPMPANMANQETPASHGEKAGHRRSVHPGWIVSFKPCHCGLAWSSSLLTQQSVCIVCVIRICYLNSAQTQNPGQSGDAPLPVLC